MDKILLDTDIFSEILKGHNQIVLQNASVYQTYFSQFTLPTITVAEITKGLWKRRQTSKLNAFLLAIHAHEVISFDASCAELAGKIFADLERQGLPIGWGDVMIGSIALTHQLTLCTGNTKHFNHLNTAGYNIKLVNWRESSDS